MPLINHPTPWELFRWLLLGLTALLAIVSAIRFGRGQFYQFKPVATATLILGGAYVWLAVYAVEPIDIDRLMSGVGVLLFLGLLGLLIRQFTK